ncbi:MAG: hypothetical protein IPJ65_32615 [Archangiaceae bacterium]|nr:hypothetical protein [Archangiaceae bacterium]
MVIRAAVLSAVMAVSSASAAERWENGIDGVGRISVMGGWKLASNDWFFARAGEGGHPVVNRGIGGPQGQASFGYGAISWLEVAIDLFVGYDRFTLDGVPPISTLSYGALLGVRFVAMDLFFPGFAPFFGVGVGPTLGYVYSGRENETFEKLVTGVSGNAGVTYRINDRVGVTLEYRFVYARGAFYVAQDDAGAGLNTGGSWFSLGVVIYFPKTFGADRMPGGP